MMNKRVAVLTGGGDVPGLNMCLKSFVYRAIDLGYEPLGVRKGWEGLIRYDPHDPSTFSQHFIELTKNRIRAVDQTAGSFLHSSRIDPRKMTSPNLPVFLRETDAAVQDVTGHIMDVIDRLGVEAVVVLGDDDMLRYAAHLSENGVPIIAIPKTIHNNIHGTEYTLGFSTGLARGVDFVHQLRALAGSREQIIVVETFGDHSGYSALLMAYLAGVDRVLIPEVPYDPLRLAYLVQQDKNMTPSNYAIVTVTNGSSIVDQKMAEAQKHLSSFSYQEVASGKVSSATSLQSSGLIVAELLQNIIKDEVFFQQLTYLMRTGAPDGQDLLGAINFGMMAANLLRDGKHGRMTAFRRQQAWTHIALKTALQGERTVDIESWYDADSYKPTDGLIWATSAVT
jgi:6-phosphofructokinase 1